MTSPRSLPPLVEGNTHGSLVVTIDEVLWNQQFPDEVNVLLQWWGDSDSVALRPVDISKYPQSSKEDTSVVFHIKTNLALFKAYITQFNKLKLLLVNSSSKEIVGLTEIDNLLDLITGLQYQNYFPIITSSGSRVGDLRVHFDLSMSCVSEETLNKKMRKRSRKKNKFTNNSFQLREEEQNPKVVKKGCKTCSEHVKPSITTETPLRLDMPNSLQEHKIDPPNTQRSDSSDCALFEIFEKGKKLRDAMVLSVLEDLGEDFTEEELQLKIDKCDKDNNGLPTVVSNNKLRNIKSRENLSPREEKLINEYLEGKTMKEEDEVLVLKTLHTHKKKFQSKLEPESGDGCKQIQDVCLSARSNFIHSMISQTVSSTDKSTTSLAEHECSTLKKINCFRLTIDTLSITDDGWKKISQATDQKNKRVETVPPPGATYFVECHLVEDSLRSQTQQWKDTALRFCSRRQIEHVVYFGQSSAHALRPPYTLASAQEQLATLSGLVSWRHLHQRLPALLGRFSLAGILGGSEVELTLNMPITCDSGITVAHVRLCLQMGRDKLFFGKALLEDVSSIIQESNKPIKTFVEDARNTRIKDDLFNFEDLCSKPKPNCDLSISQEMVDIIGNLNLRTKISGAPNLVDIPVCINCKQNLFLPDNQSPRVSSICVSCTNLLDRHQSTSANFDSNWRINIPKNFDIEEKRHHEFVIGIDKVIGFPLFAASQEELSCYVDYKFPEVTSGLTAEMGVSETTSRVVNCELQPSLSSVHRHTLSLPVVMPLSPLLATSSPGLTLRLWLRFYKPTPRDHMVALALLPMDELCLMELEFDKNQQNSAISKVLELPLALVPSSVTAPFQQYSSLGVLRLSITYSNHTSPVISNTEYQPVSDQVQNITSNDNVLPNFPTIQSNILKKCDDNAGLTLSSKDRFWTGPLGIENIKQHMNSMNEGKQNVQTINTCLQSQGCASNSNQNSILDPVPKNDITSTFVAKENMSQECTQSIKKEDFDMFAKSLENRFNQLQNDLMKERFKGLITEVDDVVLSSKTSYNCNGVNAKDDIFNLNSLSCDSSMESLPFMLGPPADFKHLQNTVSFTKNNKCFSDLQSNKSFSDTISGFLMEEKETTNLVSNDVFDKLGQKPEPVKPKTFKAQIKVDRAVNLKAIKAPSNGRKTKIPPSTWVSFGTGDCCEHNCGVDGLLCTGQRFTTSVSRRNYNPIWNLAWDVDLPIEYLHKVNKRLVFRVFEENQDVPFGFASANLSILTSGLPCLSSWLSINDLAGACKGQIKIIVTPLEDLSHYQEYLIFDAEDEFEESKERQHFSSSQTDKKEFSVIASQAEAFLKEDKNSKEFNQNFEKLLEFSDNLEDEFEGEDPVSADDVISDYKNTLENNFRNEMAGLENLIKFLRVGSVGNDISFHGATENKENSNPTLEFSQAKTSSNSSLENNGKLSSYRNMTDTSQPVNQNVYKDKILVDVSTETTNKDEVPSSSHQSASSSEDILSKLLQQISMFQMPVVKITDNTSQTVTPETRETFTETHTDSCNIPEKNITIHMKDACTETEDCNNCSYPPDESIPQPPHVCSDLGSVLLQHFLTCKPSAIKITDRACQTSFFEKESTANSSGILLRSQPSGMSTEVLKNIAPSGSGTSENICDWISSDEAHANCERLIAIDNNIKDLERFLKENLILADKDEIPLVETKEELSVTSLDGIIDTVEACAAESNHSSSEIESLDSYSPHTEVVPRETPDGDDNVSDRQDHSNTEGLSTATTLKRQGTFVIEKSNDSSDDSNTDK